MKQLLEVKNLSVTYKETKQEIVHGINFSILPGQTVALIGESGSGKSMTCKAIMGLLAKGFPASGEILFGGRDILKMDKAELRSIRGNQIAMIVQNPMSSFDPSFKIGMQMIETLQSHRDIDKTDAKMICLDMMGKMNLPRPEQLLNSYPHTLSGGMLQRIVIILALLSRPQLIIADEATTALDIKNQSIVLDELREMKNEGISILLVTHDMRVAKTLADVVLIMKEGRIIEEGTGDRIFFDPIQSYTKELLKASYLSKEVCN